jgi:DNA-directed RNA polymerase specialized sigma24 family protein
VCGEHGSGRVRVENWEVELAKGIARRFRVNDEDLAAHLLMRVVELKISRRGDIQNWGAFLAQTLYNAAKNFIRHEDVLRRRFRSFGPPGGQDEDRPFSPEERLAAPEERIDLRLDVAKLCRTLTPEMQRIWQLLAEHEGNTSAVARQLRRPRKTVEYWIKKLQGFLASRGIR